MSPDGYAALRARVKGHEGEVKRAGRHRPYRCTSGALTIGYGRNLDANGIRDDEAELMLTNDLRDCERAVLRSFPWAAALDDVRQGVLIEMVFQMGLRTVKAFPATLAAIKRGQYGKAARHMLNSRWATQTPNRARALAKLMADGA